MTRVNLDKQKPDSTLIRAIKFTIVVAVIGIIFCIVFLVFEGLI